MPSNPSIKLASLAFEIAADNSVPSEAHLLPVGPFRSADGRPEDCDAWLLDADIAARVIERLRNRQNDTLIDYEHQSLRAEYNGQKVIAAGWFHDMAWRDGKGLYAVGVDWTANAKQHITSKEYRYISAVFYYYSGTGEVLDVISVALTNTPAIDGLDGLDELEESDMAALTKKFALPPLLQSEIDMPTPQEIAALTVERDGLSAKVAALTVERDGFQAQLAALTTDRDTLKARVDAFDAEKAQAALAAETEKRDALVLAALTDGRLVPAQKPWAEKQSLATLTEYLDATAPVVDTKRQGDGSHTSAVAALTADQAKIAEQMGVTADEFLATQKKYA